jgi:hypothetical protein
VLKKVWAVFHEGNSVLTVSAQTIARTRAHAISKFVGWSAMNWAEAQKYGWRAAKFNVIFEFVEGKKTNHKK